MGSPYGGTKKLYAGPGDIVSGATAWYGLRGYSASYASPGTGNAINLRRASDNATCNFVVASSGNLGGTAGACAQGSGLSLAAFATTDATASCTAALTTLTCTGASSTPHAGSTLTGVGLTQPAYLVSCGTFTAGAGTCTLNAAQTVSVAETITMTYGLFATEAYDQSGFNNCTSAPCNVVQATAGNQPQLLPSCIVGLPCLSSNGSRALVTSGNAATVLTPQTYYAYYYPNNSNIDLALIEHNNSIGILNPNTTFYSAAASVVSITASNAAWHFGLAVQSSSPFFNLDGAITSSGPTVRATGANPIELMGNSGTSSITGYLTEAGEWPVAFTNTQSGSVYTNASSYY